MEATILPLLYALDQPAVSECSCEPHARLTVWQSSPKTNLLDLSRFAKLDLEVPYVQLMSCTVADKLLCYFKVNRAKNSVSEITQPSIAAIERNLST
jgi:hypothetical protein